MDAKLQQELDAVIYDIENYTFVELVPTSQIKTAKYCRPVSETRVDHMIREGFTMQKADMLRLSMRADGDYYILDGRHRLEAARKLEVPVFPARVFIDLTYEQEAELFRAFNTSKRTSGMDLFRSMLEAKDPHALAIEASVAKTGMHIALEGPGYPNAVASIAALQRAYADLGLKGLDDILFIISESWGNQRRAWVTAMIDGFRQFWGRYRTEVEKRLLIERLKLFTPERILAEAGVVTASTRGASSGTLIGKVLVEQYNYKRREPHKLADWGSKSVFGPNTPIYPTDLKYQAGRFYPSGQKPQTNPTDPNWLNS